MFDNLHLTNMLRSEVEHIPETGLPLDGFSRQDSGNHTESVSL